MAGNLRRQDNQSPGRDERRAIQHPGHANVRVFFRPCRDFNRLFDTVPSTKVLRYFRFLLRPICIQAKSEVLRPSSPLFLIVPIG